MATEGVPLRMSISGDPGTTVQCTLGDGAKTLEQLGVTLLLDLGGGRFLGAKAVLINCETYDCRFAFGVNPTVSGLGHLLSNGEWRYVINPTAVKNIRFINKTAGQNAVLTVTPEF